MSDEKKETLANSNFFDKMRSNPWMVSTIALAVVLVLVLFLKSGGLTGNVVSDTEASGKLLEFVNAQLAGQGEAQIVSTEKEGSLYKVMVSFQGQDIPVYVTTDGKYLISQPIPLDGTATANTGSTTTTSTPKDIPKSDKPVVELFVMSYCPYGTQMEKGILPVVAALKDKIDFTIRYTHFTLHGEKEDTENFRQLCIRETYSDKFLSYIQCTLNSTDPYAPADVDQCMKSVGIVKSKIDTCMKDKAAEYYASDSALSQGYGVQGSPTLVINGVQAESSRSPAAILATICSSFNNAPSECNTKLSSDSPSAGFGYSASSGADAAAANCGF